MGDKISAYPNTVATLNNTDLFDVSVGPTTDSEKLPWSVLRTAVDNIYNIDGTLQGARTIDQNSNTIGFINGLFGIGVAVPTLGKLQIDGDGLTQSTRGIFHRDSNNDTAHIWYDSGDSFYSGALSVGLNAPIATTGVSSNGAQFQFGFRAENIHTAADAYGFFSSIVITNANDNIGIYTTAQNGNNNYALLVDQGDMGIGTVTPTEKLHLVGNFRYEDGNEANGFVLTSDIDGVASWAAAGGGAGSWAATLAVGNTTGANDTIYSTTGVPAVSNATQLGSRKSLYRNTLWDGGAEQIRDFEIFADASTTVGEETFFRFNYDGASLLSLKQNGNFGIGIDPIGKLHVQGDGTTTGTLVLLEDSAGADRLKILDSGKFTLVTGGSASIYITGAVVFRQSSAGVNPFEIFNNSAVIRMRVTSGVLFQFTTGGANSFDVTAASIFRQSSAGVTPFQVNLSGGATLITTGTSGDFDVVTGVYKAGGVSGISFSGAITNLTVTNGIVTVAS